MKEFVGETFHKVELEGETVSGVLFEDCLFTQCRVKGAVLERCRFSGCQFTDCLLSAPKLKNVTMLSCGFSGCGISGVDWSALVDERKRDMGFLPFDSLERCSPAPLPVLRPGPEGLRLLRGRPDRQHLRQLRAGRGGLFPVPPGGDQLSPKRPAPGGLPPGGGVQLLFGGDRVRGAKFSLPEAVGLLSALGLELEGL